MFHVLTLTYQDSTLIKTVSGNRFGRDAADWTWWDASVPGTLETLSKNGQVVYSAYNSLH